MPVSVFDPIPLIFRVIQYYRPQSVLDIGVGFGKYGVLCRESLDLYYGRISQSEWITQIDGIEIFENYRNPLWKIYNQVHIGNVLDILPKLTSYDLIICSDVIEHFDKRDGQTLLRACIGKSDLLIVNTPRVFSVQDEVAGNPAEVHKALWRAVDFRLYNSICVRSSSEVLSIFMFKQARFVNRLNIFIFRHDDILGHFCRWLRHIYNHLIGRRHYQ